jgi:hypothetical protein
MLIMKNIIEHMIFFKKKLRPLLCSAHGLQFLEAALRYFPFIFVLLHLMILRMLQSQVFHVKTNGAGYAHGARIYGSNETHLIETIWDWESSRK